MEDNQRLELATLQLINLVAYATNSRKLGLRFASETGLDLPPAEIQTLAALRATAPTSTGTLASHLGIDITQASRQVARLDALGLIQREKDSKDRRRSVLSLPETSRIIMRRWEAGYINQYLLPVKGWKGEDVTALGAWFARVYNALLEALPHVGPSPAGESTAGNIGSDVERDFVKSILDLVNFVGRSRGFNELLESAKLPLTEATYFTLIIVWRHGPTTAKEVAAELAIDPSQASKRLSRLRELGLVDEATDPFDHRSVLVRASKRGNRAVDHVHTTQLRNFHSSIGVIEPPTAARLSKLAETYVTSLISPRLTAVLA